MTYSFTDEAGIAYTVAMAHVQAVALGKVIVVYDGAVPKRKRALVIMLNGAKDSRFTFHFAPKVAQKYYAAIAGLLARRAQA